MPIATFRCAKCGQPETVELERHVRDVDRPDVFAPWPKHHGRRMAPVQIQYHQEAPV